MKIRNINVKISAAVVAVVIIFTILLIITYLLTNDWHLLAWGVPALIGLAVIPMALNFMSQRSYIDVIPEYEERAKKVRVRTINLNMLGEPVRFEGVVERVYFQYLNRPQYLVADKSGEISVKMFTTPQETVRKGDIVEVLGMVMKRYVVTGDAVINAVSVKKITKEKSQKAPSPSKS
jgi:hypothetical protein